MYWGVETTLYFLSWLENKSDKNDWDDNSGGANDGNELGVVHAVGLLFLLSGGTVDKAAVHIKAGDVPFSQIWRIPASDNSDSVTLVDSGDNDRFEEA